MFIDATGKPCPMPVVMAKKELDAGCADLTVAVDNSIAVENLTRLGREKGMTVASEEKNGIFNVHFTGDGKAAPAAAPKAGGAAPVCSASGCGYAVFVGKDHVGDGDPTLGYNLLRMALYTLSQGDAVPASVLFMNSGVKLPSGDDQQVIDSLNALIAKGTEVLVCGTCLNFYKITDKLKVGTVSNMYDILERMLNAAKVITL